MALTKGTDIDDKFFDKFSSSERGLSHVQHMIDTKNTEKIDASVKKAGMMKQFGILSKRSFVNFIRSPMTF